jgi:hypothetical protein
MLNYCIQPEARKLIPQTPKPPGACFSWIYDPFSLCWSNGLEPFRSAAFGQTSFWNGKALAR